MKSTTSSSTPATSHSPHLPEERDSRQSSRARRQASEPTAHASIASPGWLLHAFSSLSGALIIGLLALFLNRPDPAPIAIHLPPTRAPTATPTATATPSPLVVFVSGAVQTPGLVTVPAGARVADALEQAGGFAPDAAVNAINQAEHLRDGAQVHVPHMGDMAVVAPPAGVSGGEQPGTAGQSATGAGDLININTASEAELITLPGIGPVKAQDIIANRPYSSIEDLDQVRGIGPATIANLRDYIVVR